MLIEAAERALRRRCQERTGLDVEQLNADQALELITTWYEEERADDALALEQLADMLLFQWDGPWLPGDPTFGFDLARQFIGPHEPDDADDAIFQLSVTLHYPRTESTDAAGSGDLWCQHPRELPQFIRTVADSPAARSVRNVAPVRVVVHFEVAG